MKAQNSSFFGHFWAFFGLTEKRGAVLECALRTVRKNDSTVG